MLLKNGLVTCKSLRVSIWLLKMASLWFLLARQDVESQLYLYHCGLEDASGGEINDADVTGKLPSERGLAMVFQSLCSPPYERRRKHWFRIKNRWNAPD